MRTKTIRETAASYSTGDAPIPAPDIFRPLTESQRTALDMRRRGINVIPLPTPAQIMAQPGYDPQDKGKKPFGILAPYFLDKPHICGPDCQERKKRIGRDCLPPEARFLNLFYQTNVGMIVGRISGNVVVLDCDTKAAFNTVVEEFETRHLKYWGWHSHNGRGHIVFRLAEGEAENNDKCKIPNVNIMGHSHFACMPPSVHPSGECYMWLPKTEPYYNLPMGERPPQLHLADLEFIGIELSRSRKINKEEVYALGAPDSIFGMSVNNLRIFVNAHRYGSRNEEITKVLYDMVGLKNYGMATDEDAIWVTESLGYRCIPPYPQHELDEMIKCALKNKKIKPARHYNKKGIQFWQVAFMFATSHDWTGRTGQTDRAVFLACCERAKLEMKNCFRASMREVQEIANIGGLNTVQKSLIRLIQAGLLQRTETKDRSAATIYKFTSEVLNPSDEKALFELIHHIQGDNTVNSETETATATMTTQEQDLFKNHRVAYRVWVYLKNNPDTPKNIAANTKQILDSVYTALRWLKEQNLAARNSADGLYYGEPVTPEKMERLAAVRGTLGYSDRRKREHIREREIRLSLRTAAKEAAYRANARR